MNRREQQVEDFLTQEAARERTRAAFVRRSRERQVAEALDRVAFEAAVSRRPDREAKAADLGVWAGTAKPVEGLRLFGLEVLVVDRLGSDWVGVRMWRAEEPRDLGRRLPGKLYAVSAEGVPYYPSAGVTLGWRCAAVKGKAVASGAAVDVLERARRQQTVVRPPNEIFVMTPLVIEMLKAETDRYMV